MYCLAKKPMTRISRTTSGDNKNTRFVLQTKEVQVIMVHYDINVHFVTVLTQLDVIAKEE